MRIHVPLFIDQGIRYSLYPPRKEEKTHGAAAGEKPAEQRKKREYSKDLPDPKQPTLGKLVGEGKYFHCSSVPRSTCADRIAGVEEDVLDTDTRREQDSMPHLSDSAIRAPLEKSATQKPQLLGMRSPCSSVLEDMQIPVSSVLHVLQVKEQNKFTTAIKVLSGPPGQLLLT
ncbi:hypothetical protein MRX96_024165 [Rhipicephalus microplus]